MAVINVTPLTDITSLIASDNVNEGDITLIVRNPREGMNNASQFELYKNAAIVLVRKIEVLSFKEG